MKKIYFVLIPVLIAGCKNKMERFTNSNSNLSTQSHFAATASGAPGTYGEGTYCATLEYYDRNTETSNDCSLFVKLENNRLTHISKSDCESIEGSDVTAAQIRKAGVISFKSDKGNVYTVTIKEKVPLGLREFQCDICGKEIQ